MQKNPLLNGTNQNPAQNISISISYNLNTTNKIPKQIIQTKKALQKSKKLVPTSGLQGIGNQFFSQLALNSLQVKNKQRKQNQSKKSNQSSNQVKQTVNKVGQKVPKKKKTQGSSTSTNKQLQAPGQHQITQQSQTIPEYYNPLASNAKHFLKRNIQSPDIFKADIGKKIKTQGSMYDDGFTVGKRKRAVSSKDQYGGLNTKTFKNTKINNFLKETINHGPMIGNKMATGSFKTMPKKSLISNKAPKSKQRHSLAAKPKRIHTQQNEPFASQTATNLQYRHNKSCMLYSSKKPLPYQNIITDPHLIETAQNIMSQYMSVNSTKARKRAQSTHIFERKDKQLVSKLLNMSMISSQLGSSQLITSQRMRSGRGEMARRQLGLRVDELDSYNKVKNVEQQQSQSKKQDVDRKQEQIVFPGNALRQYLNSIDLRIIKNIQSDTANIVTQSVNEADKKQRSNFQVNFGKKQSEYNQFAKPFTKEQSQQQQFTFSSKIPHKKIAKQSQQSIKKQKQSDVVSFYSRLFNNALQNKLFQQKEKYVESANQSQYDDVHQQIKKERFIVKGFNDEEEKSLKEENQQQQNQHQQNVNKEQQQQEDQQSENSDNELYEFVNKKPPIANAINENNKDNNNKPSMKLNFQHYKQLLQSHKQQYNAAKLSEQTQKFDFQLVTCEMESSIKTQNISNQKNLLQESLSDELQSPLKYFNQENSQKEITKNVIQIFVLEENKVQIKPQQKPSKQQQIVIKSPKHSNRQKFNQMRQPQYTQICWEYNQEQFQKQLNSQKIQEIQSKNKKNINLLQIDRGLTSSPTNNSDFGSGDQQYDSKKYSIKEQHGGDQILQEYSASKTAQKHQDRWPITTQNPTASLMKNQSGDSLFNDEESLSCEDREIGTAERWVNPAFCQLNQSPQNRSKKVQQQKENDDDYLQCSLASFGVTNKQKQEQQKKHEEANIPTIQLQINEIINSSQHSLQQNNSKQDPFAEIRKKRLTHIVEDIILELIRQFAKDISYILKKSSTQKRTNIQFQENSSPLRVNKDGSYFQQNELSPFSRDQQMFGLMGQQIINNNNSRLQVNGNQRFVNNSNNIKKSQFVGKCFGIDTSFISVQKYLKQFKEYVMKDEKMKQSVIKNINKDIGPNSLQILSYLRPQYDGMMMDGQNQYGEIIQGPQRANQAQQQQQDQQQQDGLFVVPSQAFSQFESYLQQQIQQKNKSLQPQKQIIFTQKQKRNTNFWHRGIYQSWNQFLDYQRPYGINGKPYEWIREGKKYREVKLENVQEKLQKGIDKLLQAISLPSGLIYDKFQMSPLYMDLNEEQKMYLNEERLSRMLAIELFESEQTWINYNDEMAELLVELSRVIEERVFFEVATQMKRLQRRRKFEGVGSMMIERDNIDQQNLIDSEGNRNRLGQISQQQQQLSQQRDQQRYLIN